MICTPSKVDARSRRVLAEAPEDARLEVLLRVRASPTQEDVVALRRAGLVIASQVGPVISGSIRVPDMSGIASLTCVSSIQIARMVVPEKAEG